MRYVSVVVLSLVMLVIGVSAADAVNYAQQPTAANPNNSIANKKDLCRPGMVFIPSIFVLFCGLVGLLSCYVFFNPLLFNYFC